MAASTSDKFLDTFNSANPNVATVTATRTAAATTLQCDDLSGWPTATAVSFSTYEISTSNTVVPGTQIDWVGIVSGNNIGSLTRVAGATDSGNTIGDVVELNPTATWASRLVNGLLVSLDQDGTLKDDAVVTANITDANVTTAKLADASVTAPKLSTDAITLGYAERTTNDSINTSTSTQVAGLSAAVTIPSGGRRIKITGFLARVSAGAAANVDVSIWDGTVGSGTKLQETKTKLVDSGDSKTIMVMASVVPSAGAKIYKIGWDRDASTTVTLTAGTDNPSFILVEVI